MSLVRSVGVNSEAIEKVKQTNLPSSWCWLPLESLVDSSRPICYGILMPKENLEDGVLYVKVRDFKGDRIDLESLQRTSRQIADKYRRSSLRKGDLLVSIRGTFGRVAVVPPELVGGNITQDTARLAVNSEWESMFVAYWMRSPLCQNYFKHVARGVAVRGVNIGDLKPCPCPVAPTNEQRRIVAKIEELFSDLDAGVAALKRTKANLKRYRTAVLKAAVEGKLTVEWRANHPKTEPASKLLEHILVNRRQKWETDQLAKFAAASKVPPKNWKERYIEPSPPNTVDLPVIPEGWCWTSLGQCFEICVGATPSRQVPNYWNGTIPWVSSGEVQFCRLTKTREQITEDGLANSSTRLNPRGSVLLGMIGEGKTRGQVAILDVEACNNQNCAAIWVSQTPINSTYVYSWLWSQYEITRWQSSGNNQPALNKKRVEDIRMPLAPVPEQNEIVNQVEERLSQIAAAEHQIDAHLLRAARLRQSILKQAFEGKLVPQNPKDEPASLLIQRLLPCRSTHEGSGKATTPLRNLGRRTKSNQTEGRTEE